MDRIFPRSFYTKGKGYNLGDVSVGAVHLDGDTERLAEKAHRLQTLLVVRATTTNVDLHIVIDERGLVLLQRTDDTLEGGSDVREVGDTTADDEDLALRMRCSAGDKIDCRDVEIAKIRKFSSHSLMVRAYSYVWPSVGAPLYSP